MILKSYCVKPSKAITLAILAEELTNRKIVEMTLDEKIVASYPDIEGLI